MSPIALSLESISKRFGSVAALDDVTLSFHEGEVTALLGENGAGKTTLMRIASGAETPDRGRIVLSRRSAATTYDHLRPGDAEREGIAMVHQHFLLVPELTVAENLAISSHDAPFILTPDRLSAFAETSILGAQLTMPSSGKLVGELSVGEQSRLELIKALRLAPRILILDEPTAVLAPPEVAELGRQLRRLAENGTAVILITHKLPEVFAMADRVCVLRHGRVVHDSPIGEVTPARVAAAMIGTAREPKYEVPAGHIASERPPRLRLEGVTVGDRLRDVSLMIGSGEIVAIVGVAGNGQRELAEALRGLVPSEGRIEIDGARHSQRALSIATDIAHIAPDRTAEGVFEDLTIEENLTLALGAGARTREVSDEIIREFGIRATTRRQRAGTLSGGNRQKVLLARELLRRPRVIVASEPTRGLDFEATAFVHGLLRKAAGEGAAILVITSDLDEALELARTIHVIYRGTLSPPLAPTTSIERFGALMAGLE